MLQGGLLVSPALLQPFLQTNVGGGQGAKGVADKVDVDLQTSRRPLDNLGQGEGTNL